jgi:hypothetical protein
MIPPRDGTRLPTEIYTPKQPAGPLPFIFERTPFGLHDDVIGYTQKLRLYRELIPEGFIFVFQDIHAFLFPLSAKWERGGPQFWQ